MVATNLLEKLILVTCDVSKYEGSYENCVLAHFPVILFLFVQESFICNFAAV